jgi:hypothetical protein
LRVQNFAIATLRDGLNTVPQFKQVRGGRSIDFP